MRGHLEKLAIERPHHRRTGSDHAKRRRRTRPPGAHGLAEKAKRIRAGQGPGERTASPFDLHHLRREGQAQLPLRDGTARAGANGSGAARGRDARPGRYCSTDCQRVDWRDRGHRKACKKIRAEAARDQAPTPPPSTPPEVVYGPAPRSHADEVRARIAAEHEAARARREAESEAEPVPVNARCGSRCPVCYDDWDVSGNALLLFCCCRKICRSCEHKIGKGPCPLCRTPYPKSCAELLARLRRHVENDTPDAVNELGTCYRDGLWGLKKSAKKAAKIYKRGVELGNASAMLNLGVLYEEGDGVKLDMKKADQLYRRASSMGCAIAQCNVGAMLYRAQKCNAEAFAFFSLSAAQGHVKAEFMVGSCYQMGFGVEENHDESVRWMERAAAKGYEPAIRALRVLRPSDRRSSVI